MTEIRDAADEREDLLTWLQDEENLSMLWDSDHADRPLTETELRVIHWLSAEIGNGSHEGAVARWQSARRQEMWKKMREEGKL
jgi:hypothetical protein